MADYILEGIDMVLAKYQKELKTAQKKGGESDTTPNKPRTQRQTPESHPFLAHPFSETGAIYSRPFSQSIK